MNMRRGRHSKYSGFSDSPRGIWSMDTPDIDSYIDYIATYAKTNVTLCITYNILELEVHATLNTQDSADRHHKAVLRLEATKTYSTLRHFLGYGIYTVHKLQQFLEEYREYITIPHSQDTSMEDDASILQAKRPLSLSDIHAERMPTSLCFTCSPFSGLPEQVFRLRVFPSSDDREFYLNLQNADDHGRQTVNNLKRTLQAAMESKENLRDLPVSMWIGSLSFKKHS